MKASVQHLRYGDFICQSGCRSSWAAAGSELAAVVGGGGGGGCCWFLSVALWCCCESPAQQDTPG